MRVRTVLLAAVSVISCSLAAEAREISVPMDEVRTIAFDRPVSTVFVGNSMIADVSMIDSHHAFILGKAFGVTNIIALGSDKSTISNQTITVSNRSGGVVTLNRGAQQFNYSCTTAHCETNPRPGDVKSFFDETEEAIKGHQDQGVKAASSGH